jgi:hypothetical protein
MSEPRRSARLAANVVTTAKTDAVREANGHYYPYLIH